MANDRSRARKPTGEELRLQEAQDHRIPWRLWGPYLSERQWGTVREDYSENGNAWDYFTHDQSRSRAYRWGEDGIAGISDQGQRLCFALAIWNGVDPILKERYFGLTNSEGNHGEDVKDYYFYLDNTPTHSFMKMLYKYPQRAYPYDKLRQENLHRPQTALEYELIDTGVFDDDRYFDIVVEYAKATPDDILIEITAFNRGDKAASLHILPTLWFRNTWSWGSGGARPIIRRHGEAVVASHAELGDRLLTWDRVGPLLFTENETNTERLFAVPNSTPYVKDAMNEYVVHGRVAAVNPNEVGSKMAVHYPLEIEAGGSETVRLRLTDDLAAQPDTLFGSSFAKIISDRRSDADEFYDALLPPELNGDDRLIIRQALAGMLWSKQFYYFDVQTWLREHHVDPYSRSTRSIRNKSWSHMLNSDVISMPDKWEYPWYAAWDLAFHAIPLASVDSSFAKAQLELMLHEYYLHPNGQIPAYEWNFGDVNPPVHAWATLFVYEIDKQQRGYGDLRFLSQSFNKLLMNFTWWVNRKDPAGRDVFEGGFLGLDNIGVFDRSAPLPTGGSLEQADGTAWMALFCQSMLQIVLELEIHDPGYESLALQFVRHFCGIALAMERDGLWDEEDGFFYDLLRLPDGSATPLKTRSLVGLLPLCATVVIERDLIDRFPGLVERVTEYFQRCPALNASIARLDRSGVSGRCILAIANEEKLRRILARMLDAEEFLSEFGIRSLSRYHRHHPYVFRFGGAEHRVDYEPGDSSSGAFGGNSNWRGPIWMPINALLIRALRQFYLFYGDAFTVECPTGSGVQMNLYQISEEITRRLCSIFRRGEHGRRPLFGGAEKFQKDPHWRDHLLFYEYFHGDNGAGIGASHQTGWTGLIATAIALYAGADPVQFLGQGAQSAMSALAGARRP
jgi:Mannosylglycerate hydrolase MGH1-like glycoside hydrolase domain